MDLPPSAEVSFAQFNCLDLALGEISRGAFGRLIGSNVHGQHRPSIKLCSTDLAALPFIAPMISILRTSHRMFWIVKSLPGRMVTSAGRTRRRESWNKGRLIAQRLPLKLKEIWAIGIRAQLIERLRDLAVINLAIDRKLCVCDPVSLRVKDVAQGQGFSILPSSCKKVSKASQMAAQGTIWSR